MTLDTGYGVPSYTRYIPVHQRYLLQARSCCVCSYSCTAAAENTGLVNIRGTITTTWYSSTIHADIKGWHAIAPTTREFGRPPTESSRVLAHLPCRHHGGRFSAAAAHPAHLQHAPTALYSGGTAVGKKMCILNVAVSVHRPACSQCAMLPQLSRQRIHPCIALCFEAAPTSAGWRSDTQRLASTHQLPASVDFFNEFLKRTPPPF